MPSSKNTVCCLVALTLVGLAIALAGVAIYRVEALDESKTDALHLSATWVIARKNGQLVARYADGEIPSVCKWALDQQAVGGLINLTPPVQSINQYNEEGTDGDTIRHQATHGSDWS